MSQDQAQLFKPFDGIQISIDGRPVYASEKVKDIARVATGTFVEHIAMAPHLQQATLSTTAIRHVYAAVVSALVRQQEIFTRQRDEDYHKLRNDHEQDIAKIHARHAEEIKALKAKKRA